MPTRPLGLASRSLKTLFNLGALGDATDGQLLERFANRDGEGAELAFAALVERHGPMVLRACRSVLRDPHDAQDAFQAAFLVLSRRAETLWVRDSIAPWLLAVALRVARSSRRAAIRRARLDRRVAEQSARSIIDAPVPPLPDDLEAAIHEELDRLPGRFREPIVLCDLQGRTYDQAARHLGLPVGTLKSRLSRGRSRLGDRLRRLGHAPTPPPPPFALASPSLIDPTAAAALRASGGLALAGTVPAASLLLANGVLRMMRLQLLARWTAATLCLALAGGGFAAATMIPSADDPPAPIQIPVSDPNRDAESEDAPLISYEVTFIELPGPSLRKFGLDMDFKVGLCGGLAFLADLEEHLFSEFLASTPNARQIQTPKFTARSGQEATASVGFGPIWVKPFRPVLETSTSEAVGARLVREVRRPGDSGTDPTPVHRVRETAADDDDTAQIRRSATIRGVLSDDRRYVKLNLDLDDIHVVAIHPIGDEDGGQGPDQAPLAVPEIVHARLDQGVTVPSGGSGLLLSLGLFRTVDDDGESTIAEHLVLIHAQRIEPTPGQEIDPRPEPTPSGEAIDLGP